MDQYKKGKNLSKEAPVSPKLMLGGMVVLARTIDKCRAALWGDLGEYNFDCPVDKSLFGWKGISADAFKAYVSEGHSNSEIAEWVKSNGTPKTDAEIQQWNAERLANDMSYDAGKKAWLEGENKRLGLDKDGTLFDMLIADDKASLGNAK